MTAIGDLFWVLRGDTDQLDKDVDASVGRVQQRLDKSGKAFTAGATVPLVAFAAAGVRAYGDIASGLREVVTLTGEVGAQADATFNEFQGSVEGLSDSLGVARSELVDGLYSSLSAGVPRDNVVAFLETATKAAIAGKATTEQAVDGITSAINAFGLEFAEADRVADVFFSTVRNGKTTLPELSAVIGNVAPIAKLAGVSLEEVAASLSTLTANGLSTSVASTQVRAAIQALTKPSKEMTAIWEDYGFASGTAAIEQLGLQGAMAAVFDAAEGDVGALTTLLGTTEAVGAVSTIAGVGAQKFASDLDDAAASAGAAAAAFGEIDKARDVERLINDLKNLAIDIGATLAPAVKGFAQVMSEVLAIINKLPSSAIVGFGAVVAAIGPLQLILAKLVGSKEGMAGLKKLGPVVARAFATGPMAAFTVALAGITTAFFVWQKRADDAARRADIYTEAIAEAGGGNDSLAKALAGSTAELDKQASAFDAALSAASGEGVSLAGIVEDTGNVQVLEDLLALGLSLDDLVIVAETNFDESLDETQRFNDALDALGIKFNDFRFRSITQGLDNYAKTAKTSREESDKLADAQLKIAVAEGLLTQRQATRIRINAELRNEVGALSDETERYFNLQRITESGVFDSTGAYDGLRDAVAGTAPTFAELQNAASATEDTLASAGQAASGYGSILSTQFPDDVAAFIEAADAGRLAGERLAQTEFDQIGLDLEEALTGVLDIDTSNGVNDVQDAINNITDAVGGAEASLAVLSQRVEAIEKLRELGPELGTAFENLIPQLAAGLGDGLLDDIIGIENIEGVTNELLTQLEADLGAAEALTAELKLEVDQSDVDGYNETFATSFVNSANAGLSEFEAEIIAATEAGRLDLKPDIDVDEEFGAMVTRFEESNPLVTPEIDDAEQFEAMLTRYREANPTLTVQVKYVDGFGVSIQPPEPGFVFGNAPSAPTPGATPSSAEGSGGDTNIDILVNATNPSADVGDEIVRALVLEGVAE